MSTTIVQIENHHTERCGQAPRIEHARVQYLGYYENRYGEQWVLTDTGDRILLQGGDLGWDQEVTLTDEGDGGFSTSPPIVFNDDEIAWLRACMRTIRVRRQDADDTRPR